MHRVLLTSSFLVLAGCVSVRPVVAPREFIPRHQPDIVWVTQPGEPTLPVASPSVRGDTLLGVLARTRDPVAIPLGEGRQVFAKQKDRTRTTLLAVGIGALAGFVVWRATRSGSDCVINPSNGECFP
ncbi:MAG TPA: hypothetical protein VNI61_02825 [Gemmatimonadales bacterium]|nr:hypothetical protein [Gemmatimonadales bacterium]